MTLRTRVPAALLAALLALTAVACANEQRTPDTDSATEEGS